MTATDWAVSACPAAPPPRITLGDLVLTGIASLQFTGRAIVMNQPELGGLITAFSLNGHPYHTFGVFRRTGHEADRELHLAAQQRPAAGQSPPAGTTSSSRPGAPLFRRYDDNGQLLFERHVEGPELDPLVAALPTVWPRRPGGGGRELPIVPPTVRAAAVDPDGYLWIALTVPYVYVYDPRGEKVRTLSLRGAGILNPTSLAFAGRDRLLVTPGCYEFTVR